MAGQTRINGNLIDTGTDPEDIVSISAGDARYPKLDGPNTLTGDLTVDNGTLFVDSANNRVGVGTSSPNRDLEIYANTYPTIAFNEDGNITSQIESHTADKILYNSILDSNYGFGVRSPGDSQRFRIAPNGDISFYEDTGTTPKFFWDASAERLGIGTSSPAKNFVVSDGSQELEVGFDGSGNLEFSSYDRSAGAYKPVRYRASDIQFETGSPGTSEAARINSDGQLLIGRTFNQGLSGELCLSRKLAVVGGQGGTMVLDCAGVSGSFSTIKLNFGMGNSSSAIVELQIAGYSGKELDFLAMQYSSSSPGVIRNTGNGLSASLTGSSVNDFEVTVTGGVTHPVVFVKVVAGRSTPSFSVEPTLTFI